MSKLKNLWNKTLEVLPGIWGMLTVTLITLVLIILVLGMVLVVEQLVRGIFF